MNQTTVQPDQFSPIFMYRQQLAMVASASIQSCNDLVNAEVNTLHPAVDGHASLILIGLYASW